MPPFGSQLSRFNYATVEKIYNFLRQKGIVTEEDIKDMRKLSLTSERRLLGEEIGLGFGIGGSIGIWRALKIILKDVASGK